MTTDNETEVLKREAKLHELERDKERFERGERTSRAPVVLTIKSNADLFRDAGSILQQLMAGGAR